MPDLCVLPDGDLEISITPDEITDTDWKHLYRNGSEAALWELLERNLANGWHEVPPEAINALTEAPIISDEIEYPDSGEVVVTGRVWWYPDYALRDPLEELRKHGRVAFTKGGDAIDAVVDCELCQRQGCPTCNGTGIILFDVEEGNTVEAMHL